MLQLHKTLQTSSAGKGDRRASGIKSGNKFGAIFLGMRQILLEEAINQTPIRLLTVSNATSFAVAAFPRPAERPGKVGLGRQRQLISLETSDRSAVVILWDSQEIQHTIISP